MENKYFTPDIEDIRVGYECEWYSKKEGWQSYTISNLDEFEQLDLDRMRVPYLTKEQIEAKGWKPVESKIYPKDAKDTCTFLFEKDNFIVTFYSEERTVFFFAKDLTKLDWMCITPRKKWGHGLYEMFIVTLPCKSINEFRYICKLLNIN